LALLSMNRQVLRIEHQSLKTIYNQLG